MADVFDSERGKGVRLIDISGKPLSAKWKDKFKETLDPESVAAAVSKTSTRPECLEKYRQLDKAFLDYRTRIASARSQTRSLCAAYNQTKDISPSLCETVERYGDYSIVKHDSLYGIAYKDERLTLFCEYDKIEKIPGFDGVYKIAKGNKWGVANNDEVTLECVFDAIERFGNGSVCAVINKWGGIYPRALRDRYVEYMDSTGYVAENNLFGLLNQMDPELSKEDNQSILVELTFLGEHLHRSYITALSCLYYADVMERKGDIRTAETYYGAAFDADSRLDYANQRAGELNKINRENYRLEQKLRRARIWAAIAGFAYTTAQVTSNIASAINNNPQTATLPQTVRSVGGVSQLSLSENTTYSDNVSRINVLKQRYSNHCTLARSVVDRFMRQHTIMVGCVSDSKPFNAIDRNHWIDAKEDIEKYIGYLSGCRSEAAQLGCTLQPSQVESDLQKCAEIQMPRN